MAHPRSANEFGNPKDLTEYVRKLEGPDRDEWQKPGEVLRALELRRDQVVGEIGAGSGYFTLRLAPAVTHVFASDADVRLVELLRQRVALKRLERARGHRFRVREPVAA